MVTQIDLGGIILDVIKKKIKNLHLRVYPPLGKVRISAPLRMSTDTIRLFAESKLGWIKEQQCKVREQERPIPHQYLDRESHYLWGEEYLLNVVEQNAAERVERHHRKILLQVRPGSGVDRKKAVLEEWYREQLHVAILPLIEKWEPLMDVKVTRLFVQRMKTRWGSCNTGTGSIRLNTELAKKPRECLESVVVHEMVHLLEPTHNKRFFALMNQFMPQWPIYRHMLNRFPIPHG